MSDIKPLNWTTKTLARLSYLSLEFQTLYITRACPALTSPWNCTSDLWTVLPYQTECMQVRERESARCNMIPHWRTGTLRLSPGSYNASTTKKSTPFSGHYLLTEPADGHVLSLVANFCQLQTALFLLSRNTGCRAFHNRAAACVAAGVGIFENQL
jgi:hypothetical protein